MLIVGIDPGMDGGFAFFRNDELIELHIMPKNNIRRGGVCDKELLKIAKYIKDFDEPIKKVFIELVWSQPNNGVRAAYSFGFSTGTIYTALASQDLYVEDVLPKRWQDLLPCRVKHSSNGKFQPKPSAKASAKRLFPKFDFLATPKSYVPHSGLVDATMIGYFGVRTNITQ